MNLRSQTTIYFIRHGQTPANRLGIEQGVRVNEYLDTLGIRQLEEAIPQILPLNLDLMFSSQLFRSEQTAALINKHLKSPIPVFIDHRLEERDFGSLSGKTQSEIEKVLPDFRRMDIMQTYDYTPFGGETVAQVRERLLSCVWDMAENYANNNIGVVTHAGPLRLLLFHFPEIIRIYHTDHMTKKKDIGNTDIYEWTITDGVKKNIKSLLK